MEDFSINTTAFWFAAAFAFSAFLLKNYIKAPKPFVRFSDLANLRTDSPSWRVRLIKAPEYFFYASLAFFLLALLDPHYLKPRKINEEDKPRVDPKEGIAIYLLLDQSGSMQEKIFATDADGRVARVSKIDLVSQVSREFVKKRINDLIGLVYFARIPQIVAPLTLDHAAILKDLAQFTHIGTDDLDGTGIGYAIYKTASLIAATRHYAADLAGAGKPAYDIKSAIIVVLTDGFQQPSPLDEGNRLRLMGLEDAAAYAKELGIKIYMISVDPQLSSENYAPQRRQMARISEMTGGKYYLVDRANSLDNILTDIDNLEKSRLPQLSEMSKEELPHLYQRVSFYPILIAIGILSMIGAIFLKTYPLRKSP